MNPLIEAYKNTKFKVYKPMLTIEIGKINHELNALVLLHNSSEWAFITAYNPYSVILTKEENFERHNQLIELTKNYATFEGHGVGEDPTWEPELSLLIIGITATDAKMLGVKFEQNAIVYGTIQTLPELVILNTALT